MQYTLKSGQLEKQKSSCIICPVFSDKKLSPLGLALDAAYAKKVSAHIKKEQFSAKLGEVLWFYPEQTKPGSRVCLLGMGKERGITQDDIQTAVAKLSSELDSCPAKDCLFLISDLITTKSHEVDWVITQLVGGIQDARYRFEKYKSSPSDKKRLQIITFFVSNRQHLKAGELAIERAFSIAQAKYRARDVGNTPPNDCTPTDMAKRAQAVAKAYSAVSVKVLEEADMRKLKMGALLSVTQGSETPAKLVHLSYKGAKAAISPIVLVGKGITFDTGGLSLKPPKGMVTMKYDMLGAATVLAVIEACAELSLPLNVEGILACSENCIGPKATKPDTVVRSMAGITIEITNTDAEGRLVLCDALSYAETLKPDVVIDMATLTGGVIVALGDVASGIMSNNPALEKALVTAGEKTGDYVWPLPCWSVYDKKLTSKIADFKNEAGFPSSVLAGCFLSQFTKQMKWAHLDIAGTAFTADKCATGRPVHLIMEYLFNRCKAA